MVIGHPRSSALSSLRPELHLTSSSQRSQCWHGTQHMETGDARVVFPEMEIIGKPWKTFGNQPNYHLVMTNIAMENPKNKWRFLGKSSISIRAIYAMAMLVITRGYSFSGSF